MSGIPKGKSPSQLSAMRERIRVFLAAVQSGASNRSAAAEAGISLATIHRWMHGERPFDEAMRNRLLRAQAIRERRWLGFVESAAQPTTRTGRNGRVVNVPGDWRAATWLLERTNPEFAQVARAEISGPGGGAIRVEQDIEHRLAAPDPGRMAKVVELLARAGAVPQLETHDTNGNGNGSHGDGPS